MTARGVRLNEGQLYIVQCTTAHCTVFFSFNLEKIFTGPLVVHKNAVSSGFIQQPVKLFSKLNYFIFGYFDPTNTLLDNKIDFFLG